LVLFHIHKTQPQKVCDQCYQNHSSSSSSGSAAVLSSSIPDDLKSFSCIDPITSTQGSFSSLQSHQSTSPSTTPTPTTIISPSTSTTSLSIQNNGSSNNHLLTSNTLNMNTLVEESNDTIATNNTKNLIQAYMKAKDRPSESIGHLKSSSSSSSPPPTPSSSVSSIATATTSVNGKLLMYIYKKVWVLFFLNHPLTHISVSICIYLFIYI